MSSKRFRPNPPANRPNAVAALNAAYRNAATAAPASSSIEPSVSTNRLTELDGAGGATLGDIVKSPPAIEPMDRTIDLEQSSASDTEQSDTPLVLYVDNLEGPFARYINGIYRIVPTVRQNSMPVYKKGNSMLSYLVKNDNKTKGIWVFTVHNKKIGFIKSRSVYPHLIDYSKNVWNFSDVDENNKPIEGTPNVPHPEIVITKYDSQDGSDYGFFDEEFYGGKSKKLRRKSRQRRLKNKRNTKKRITRRR